VGNIQVDAVKADVKDRLSNFVERGQISSAVQNKLLLSKRLSYAIDQAYSQFVVKARPELLSQLTTSSDATIDTSINESSAGAGDGDGVRGQLKVYVWPTEAYSARELGGVLNYVINDIEYKIGHSLPYISLKGSAESIYYGSDAELFSVDFDNKLIYAPVDSTVELRYIKTPQNVTNDNITELLIDQAYQSDITGITINSLLQVGQQLQEQEQEEEPKQN